jgi:ferritin-like protein
VRPYLILRYFEYLHLPAHLQLVSKPFSDLAILMAGQLPEGPEVEAMLRRLLEAKDCAVRAALG